MHPSSKWNRHRSHQTFLVILALAGFLPCGGCSRGPSLIKPPYYEPEKIGGRAVELYDQDGDGQLSATELKACPGIASSMKKYDTDGDGKVSAEEIAHRVQFWIDSRSGIQGCMFKVTLNGRPLASGRVELDPEPFLAGIVPAATGKIGRSGVTSPSAAAEDLPAGVKGGMRCGIYKLRITHPKLQVPACYNTETELGLEIGPDFDFFNPPIFSLRNHVKILPRSNHRRRRVSVP